MKTLVEFNSRSDAEEMTIRLWKEKKMQNIYYESVPGQNLLLVDFAKGVEQKLRETGIPFRVLPPQ